MKIKINSEYSVGEYIFPDFEDNLIKNEPMLFNCDLENAFSLGGPITKEILNKIPEDWKKVPVVVDSRVHMLMQGWYPCIPGWHHDDVPRSRSDGQPNYSEGENRSKHLFVLLNGDIAPTAFATGEAEYLIPEIGQRVYNKLDRQVESFVDSKTLLKTHAPSNRLVFFDDRTFHTGVKAKKFGWRFFIRVSRYFNSKGEPIDRGNIRTNEVRKQVQFYMDDVTAGW